MNKTHCPELKIPFKIGAFFSLFAILAHGSLGETVEGVIAQIDRGSNSLTLDTGTPEHGKLDLRIGRGDSQIYEEGDKIRGDLAKVGGTLRLQTIWPNDSRARGTISNLGNKLRRNTASRGSKAFRAVGEYMPKFALFDDKGDLFLSESLKDNYVVMNFIFTRCTMQNMCPAATERMKRLQAMAREQEIENLELLSVSLDPEFDTPGIFTAYAKDKEIPTDNFHFLSGPTQIIEDLKKQMGILAEKDPDEIIKHTLSTALIDPSGKVIYRIPGSMWDPEVFIRQIKKDKDE